MGSYAKYATSGLGESPSFFAPALTSGLAINLSSGLLAPLDRPAAVL